MGLFVSLSAVPATKEQVTKALDAIVKASDSKGIGYHVHTCKSGHTVVVFGDKCFNGGELSRQLSERLRTPAFFFHIHDGDFWMYELCEAGVQVDQFNPIPDYWQEVGQDEWKKWQGSAKVVATTWPGVSEKDVVPYLRFWNGLPENTKARPDDECGFHDCWQMTDFMARLGLEYPPEPVRDEVEAKDDESVPEYDRRNYAGVTPLVAAVANGRVDEVLDLIRMGADVNKCTGNGDAPLHCAVTLPTRHNAEDFISIVGILLSAGANPNAFDEYRSTPLHLAANLGNLQIAVALIDGGASVNPVGQGMSPLMLAALSGHESMVRLLLQKGADANYGTKDGSDVLSCAKRSGCSAVISLVSAARQPPG